MNDSNDELASIANHVPLNIDCVQTRSEHDRIVLTVGGALVELAARFGGENEEYYTFLDGHYTNSNPGGWLRVWRSKQ